MTPEDMIAKLSGPLSLRRRILAVVGLLGGSAAAGVTGLLGATEPRLPMGTKVAFAMIVLVGLAWATYGVWVLTRRTPLYALDRVIAAWLAVAAVALFAAAVLALMIARDHAGPLALGTVAVLEVMAVANLVRARARRAALLRRKRELGG